MKVGLFFGSFNPIHIGHLIIANSMLEFSGLDSVWFVVSPHNPHKKKSTLLHEFDRLEMVRLAIADNPKLQVSDIEFNLPQPSYTIDTLAYISEKYPQHEFSLIMGEDNLQHFHKWKNHLKILEYHSILLYSRPNSVKTEWHKHPKIKFVNAPLIDISATYLRYCIRSEKSIKYMVHDDVANMIKFKKYYLD